MGYLPLGCILGCCGPLGVGDNLSVFPGGVSTVVGDIGVPLSSTVVSVNITGLSVVCLVHICMYI